MAEHGPQDPVQALSARRWRDRTAVAVTVVVVAGSGAASGVGTIVVAGPPLPPGRGQRLVSAVLSRRRRFGRWIRLCLAPPVIGRTPESLSDTPALPTVGRPRDHPQVGRRASGALGQFLVRPRDDRSWDKLANDMPPFPWRRGAGAVQRLSAPFAWLQHSRPTGRSLSSWTRRRSGAMRPARSGFLANAVLRTVPSHCGEPGGNIGLASSVVGGAGEQGELAPQRRFLAPGVRSLLVGVGSHPGGRGFESG
jgi:hypothetical protein